jgi:hypothetical protein
VAEPSKDVWLVAGEHWALVWHLPRLLRHPGVRLTLLAPPGQPFRHSRWVHRWIPLPRAAAAAAEVLRAEVERARPDLVLHTAQDVVEALAAQSNGGDGLPAPAPDFRAALHTKTGFQCWAEQHQLPVPPGRVCADPEEAIDWVRDHGRSILKCDGVHGGFGVSVVDTPSAVGRAWAALGASGPLLIQSFVAGPVGVVELVLRGGEPLAWCASTKERTSRPYGASVMRRLWTPAGLSELVPRLSRATGMTGLCGFDWVREDATGAVRLLEFHPRAPSGYACGRLAGVDFAAALADLIWERDAPVRAPAENASLARAPLWCAFPGHLFHALRHRPRDLRYWLPGSPAVSWRNVPWDDPGALLAVLGRALIRRRPTGR